MTELDPSAPAANVIRDPHIDDLVGQASHLGYLAMRFAQVRRTGVCQLDQVTPESDTDHTVMVTWLAVALAGDLGDLDLGKVALYAAVHDAVEVHAGDTPTLDATPSAERLDKATRERKALHRLRREFPVSNWLGYFAVAVSEYERQVTVEARFVRAVDKIVPKIVALHNDCSGLRAAGATAASVRAMIDQQVRDMRAYCVWEAVRRLHAELSGLVIARLEELEEVDRGRG